MPKKKTKKAEEVKEKPQEVKEVNLEVSEAEEHLENLEHIRIHMEEVGVTRLNEVYARISNAKVSLETKKNK